MKSAEEYVRDYLREHGPSHGLDIVKAAEESLPWMKRNGLRRSSIYRTLHWLEDIGLVESRPDPTAINKARRLYSLVQP